MSVHTYQSGLEDVAQVRTPPSESEVQDVPAARDVLPTAALCLVEDRESVMARAGRQAVKWRRRRRLTIGVSAALFPVSFLIMALATLDFYYSTCVISGFLVLVGSLVGLLCGVLMRPLAGNPLNELWRSVDTNAVGPLLEAQQMLLPETTQRAGAALLRLLPAIDAAQVNRLSPYQRHCLRLFLGAPERPDPNYASLRLEGVSAADAERLHAGSSDRAGSHRKAVMAVLKALASSGTSADVPVIEQLAQGTRFAPADAEVIAEARTCLECLNARLEMERSNSSYLRASDAPMSGDKLLRAAQGASGTPSELLLRGAPSDETKEC